MNRRGVSHSFGLRGDAWTAAIARVLESVQQHSLETVRISFADQHGILRGKVVMADDLPDLLEHGVPVTSSLLLKDTSHTTVFPIWNEDAGFGAGWLTGASDLWMMPAPDTFRVLPWSSASGWMLADLCYPDGSPVEISTRQILRQAVARLQDAGMEMVCGLEVEFAVYRVTSPNLEHRHSGKPQQPPDTALIAHGYQYLTEQHYDRLESVMTLIRRHAQALELPVRTLEAEFGPSQLEVTFHPTSPLEAADQMVLFRSMVKQVCARESLHATFMCRPGVHNAMGNGWHFHQSIRDAASGHNLFVPDPGSDLSSMASRWVAGLLEHAVESCLLTTPTINGYKRYQPFTLAPDRVQWGRDNRGVMIRSLCAPDYTASRVENRIGDSAANPYLYIASQLFSGVDGVERRLVPPRPVETPYTSDAVQLPTDLAEALKHFSDSGFWRDTLGAGFVDYFTQIKRAEWNRYMQSVSDWEHREYFSLF